MLTDIIIRTLGQGHFSRVYETASDGALKILQKENGLTSFLGPREANKLSELNQLTGNRTFIIQVKDSFRYDGMYI